MTPNEGEDYVLAGEAAFIYACENLGVSVTDAILDFIRSYLEYLVTFRGRRVVGYASLQDTAIKLLADSFSISHLPLCLNGACIDLGSGNGWPGLAVKAVWPQSRLALLDSRLGACRFLEGFVEKSGLKAVEVVCDRAEHAARETGHRERYDLAVSRAMASPGHVLEFASGFIRVGGQAVLWLGPEQERMVSSRPKIPQIGLGLESLTEYRLPGNSGRRLLALYRKESPLDERYPRAMAGMRRLPLLD